MCLSIQYYLEEVWGPHPAKDLPFVLGVNLPWVLFPLINLFRMMFNEHPFTVEEKAKKSQ